MSASEVRRDLALEAVIIQIELIETRERSKGFGELT